MKPHSVVLIGLLCLCAVVPAQWLETTIPVPQSPEELTWSPALNRLYAAVGYPDAFGAVAVVDGASNAVLDTVMLRYQMPGGICADPAGNRVFCTGSSYYPLDESLVTVIDGATDSILADITVGGGPRALCYNPAGNKIYAASQLADRIYIIDGTDYTIRATRSVPAWPIHMLYAPEVNKVFCAEQGSRMSPNFMVTVIDGTTDSILRTIFVGHYVQQVCYNPTSRKVYSADYFDGTVTVIDADADTVLARVNVGSFPYSLCWNPLTNRVYCTDGQNGTLSVIDGVTNQPVSTINLVGPAWAVLVDPVGAKIYCSNFLDGKVTVLNARDEQFIKTIDVGTDPRAMCLNPANGRIYVANRTDNAVAVIRDSASGGVEEVIVHLDIRHGAIDVWPNPSSGELHVSLVHGPTLAEPVARLYDPQGRAVAGLRPGANDLSHVAAGTYFVHADGTDRTIKLVLR